MQIYRVLRSFKTVSQYQCEVLLMYHIVTYRHIVAYLMIDNQLIGLV